MNTLLQSGFRIPQDVAVMAFGDTLTGHFAPIPMSTVSLRHDLMCRIAVETLNRLMDQPKAAKPSEVQEIIRPELIVRSSA